MKTRLVLYLIVIALLGSCNKPNEASSEKEIVAFSVLQQVGETLINSELATVFVQVDRDEDLTAITPEIAVSEKATISPASGVVSDFSNGSVIYTVTAEDNSTKEWEITVVNKKSDEAKILSFYLYRQKSEALIGDSVVTIEVKLGTNLATLKPEIEVSPNATISPASLEEVDFSDGSVVYTVTAESGKKQEWTVEVLTDKIYEANILTFTVPNQIGETVFEKTNIYIEVPVGYDFTNVLPTITITEETTVSPASGETVDFSDNGYVDFVVTTEIDSKKPWRVFLTEYVTKPNNPYVQYMGRVDWSNELKPRLSAPGATVKVKFRGTYCQAIIEDQELYGSYHNYLQILIDGVDKGRVQTTHRQNTIDIAKDLTDGEHTLSITKTTEAGIGFIDIVGFRCDELLEPDPQPERRIEFIGNSITCGYGNDVSQINCKAGEWYENNNAYIAYGPIVARALNAQWMLSSVSGIGLIHSCCDNTFEMPDVYEKVNLSTSGNAWDFSKYKANVVTIALGQNDGVQDSTTFCSAYVNFIGTIRSKYPDAHIICLTSPMADDYLFNSQKNYLTGIVEYMNNASDNKVHKLFLTHKLNNGCEDHPNLSEHELIAGELETYLKGLMGW